MGSIGQHKAALLWTAVWVGVTLVLFTTSTGEPVCEGPLITQVNDSFPPGCPSPSAALPVLVGLYVVSLAAVLGVQAMRRRS